MKHNILADIFKKRAALKSNAEIVAQEAEDKVLESDVKYRDMKKRYNSEVMEMSKLYANSNISEETMRRLIVRNEFTSKEIIDYAKDMKYNFKPKYKCSFCKDTLYVDGSYCNCVKQEINKAVMKASGIETINQHTFEEVNFDKIPEGTQRENLKALYAIMSQYVIEFKTKCIGYKPHNVVFSGSPGLGKTFLMECVASDAAKHMLQPIYIKAFELMQYFLKIMMTNSTEEKTEMWDMLLNADILFIDDLGTEPQYKNISYEYLLNLIDYRYSKNKPFFISTNLESAELMTRYGDRLYSRLLDISKTFAYTFEGKDMRLPI